MAVDVLHDAEAEERNTVRALGCLALMGLFVVGAVLLTVGGAALIVLPNAARDDAAVPDGIDSNVEQAIESGFLCPSWSHVQEYRLSATNVVRFTCTWTVLGWPRLSGSATCGDGRWNVSGGSDLELTDVSCAD